MTTRRCAFVMNGGVLCAAFLFCCGLVFSDQLSSERPSENGEPTAIQTVVFLIDVDAIDGANQSFTANVFLLLNWFDSRLAHDGDGPNEVPIDRIWHPRIQIVNQQKVWKTFPEVVDVSPDGAVTYRQRVWGSFSQPLRLRDFPFDRQSFSVLLAAAGLAPDEVEFIDNAQLPSGVSEELSLADWEVLGWTAQQSPYALAPGIPGVAGFKFTFEARRYPGYFVSKVILPLIFIVAMSWVVFWIDPESGTRISVSVTAMLTLIAYRFAVGSFLPLVSYLTRMDLFVLGSTILVFATLVEVVFTTTLASKGRQERALQIDRLSRWVFPSAFLAVIAWSFWL